MVGPNPLTTARRLAGRTRRRLRDWWRGETAATFFDIHDKAERNALLNSCGADSITVREAQTAAGARLNVARRVWQLRADLRKAFPLGLTPAQRRAYAGWLLTRGATDFGLTPAAVVAYLAELADDPAHGLVDSYLWQPDWQAAVPHGLTRFGWDDLKQWVGHHYEVRGRWLAGARLVSRLGPWDEVRTLWRTRPELRDKTLEAAAIAGNPRPLIDWFRTQTAIQPDEDWLRRLAQEIASGLPARPGVNVLAHFRYPSGVEQEAVQMVARLTAAGYRVARRDVPVGFPCDCDSPDVYSDPELHDITLVKTGGGRGFDGLFPIAGLHPRPGVYRVAGWSWELEQFPQEFVEQGTLANEVWTPSEFCAAAVRHAVPDKPVKAIYPVVVARKAPPPGRAELGLRDGRFLVLFAFDMGSMMERKNPLGLIRAFRRAFAPSDPADLVLKVSRGKSDPESLARLTAAAADAGATIIDRTTTQEEALGLIAACDCYASLHRAEGFGATVAEAMLLGKPVLSTDYSATAEFVTADVGLPVRYRLVPVGPDCAPYPPDAVWAEPDEAHAAALLRWVYEHPTEARELGRRAIERVETMLAPEIPGRLMAERLGQILADRRRAGA
jgi:glycosyltransferase involved in cell wall biosynthesis